MRRQRGSRRLLALILGFSLLAAAAACGDDDDDDAAQEPSAEEEVPEGGDLVIGAEQEGECLDYMGSCGGSSWNFWMAGHNTLPTSFEIVLDGDQWVYEPSILLAGEPELQEDPQVVTYQIADDAVWSDETPITCADYVYTWDQVANGPSIFDRTGYQSIGSVDCPEGEDGKAVVVTYDEPYAGWRSLFGGQYGLLPAHILEGQDRNVAMRDGYDFSGGPWRVDEWSRGEQLVLVPNESYWGQVPRLDSVTFRFITDSSAEFEAFVGGEVDSIYPQPQLDTVEQVTAGIEGATLDVQQASPNAEALYLNNSAFPFDSQAVRQALAYALDRDALVERLFGGIGVTEATQGFNPPILGDFGDPEAFGGYEQDLDTVTELMEGDGWTRGDDGVWEKAGQRATFAIKTTAGNARRELTEDIIVQQAGEAGFEVTTDNQEAGDLFGTQLPQGDFQAALYANVLTSLEPSLCSIFCSDGIPSEGNEFSGQNFTRTDVSGLDEHLREVDANPDTDERSQAAAEADALLAESATSIPLDPLPNIAIWSDRIVGPKENHPIWGPFANMQGWGISG
ncbi:MAG: ABC transporter substrate-binding protein [Acidimicrobiales bacterium]